MTDRAQPGAIKSLARNDELAQTLAQLTGRFDDGWVADPADPTPASTRRSDIDESAFDGFTLSGVSASSLSVDVGPGEAFAGGWFARDTSTTVSLPTNTTSTIVAAMDVNAVYDPQSDPDRDAADRVVIDVASNVSDDLPRVRLHDVTADGSGVTATTDLRKPYGPTLEADSGTVGTLEATGTFTDPAGISYDGAINPVQVTEEASTFAEADLTITNNKTEINGGSIKLSGSKLIDDFESNDLSVENPSWGDWFGDTGSFSAQNGTVISGSYTGELIANNEQNRVDTIRSDPADVPRIDAKIRIGSDTGDSAESVTLEISGDGGTFAYVDFKDSTKDIDLNFTDTGENWSVSTNHTISLRNIDYSSETFDFYIDGSEISTAVSFNDSGSYAGIDGVALVNTTSVSGASRAVYIDDIIPSGLTFNSGDVLVKWDSGVPADLDSYDLATFQRTQDGETVTVDVEDGSGNVLFSDISQNFDISTVDTSKNVKLRANLSRNDTSNNPTVDYLARRFNRS